MKCVLERMRSPVSRALRISRWTTRRDKPEWEKEKYWQPLRLLLAEPEYLLYFWLGRMHGNILCLFATDSCPTKCERHCPNELVQMTRAKWSHWTNCEVEQRVQTCIYFCAYAWRLHPSILRLRVATSGWPIDPAWSFCILTKLWIGECLLELQLRLMKAWIDGDFPCWMGKRRCWIDYRWRVLEIAFLIWAVKNPIHFEVWVETGVLQILHVQTRFGWYQIECGPATKDWREKVWPNPSPCLIQRFDRLNELLLLQDHFSKFKVIPRLDDWRVRYCARWQK